MKRTLILLGLFSVRLYAGPLFGEDQEVPPVWDDPALVYVPAPPANPQTPPPGPGPDSDDIHRVPSNDIHRVPWTLGGARFLNDGIRQFCQNGGLTTCENVKQNSGENDSGVKVYKDGKFLFVFDRAIAEEVQQDYAAARRAAEEHHPYSKHIAKLESKKSHLEYITIACNSGFGPYCGGMAAKMEKLSPLILAACAGALSTCQKLVKDKQNEIQKEIDKVLSICQKSDQACFDYITGGKETEARIQSELEKTNGERPPHTPSAAGYRPRFMPGNSGIYVWGSDDCENCKFYEGKEAENY